jgi:thiol:disulfide interchange protein DsbC
MRRIIPGGDKLRDMKSRTLVLITVAWLAGEAQAAPQVLSQSAATTQTAPAQAGTPAQAAAAASSGPVDPRVAVAAKIPGAKPEDVHPTPIPGIYELMRGTDAAYVTADGKYAILGDLYLMASNDNLTEARRRDARLKLLAGIPESQMVIFGPQDARHTITVFTDVDCAYCRKLHSQIAEYNRLGIRVRYVSYPRTGPNTESWTRAEQVWCAPDRRAALTRAKLGQSLAGKVCPNNPVAAEYALGQEFNLQGTPAIILGDGEMIPGYEPPEELAQQLKSISR